MANTKAGTEAAYKRFRQGVTLYALGLDSLETKLNRESYTAAHADNASDVVREIKVTMSLKEASDNHFDVSGSFEIMVNTKAGDSLLRLVVHFSAHFHSEGKEAVDNHAGRFAQTEARLVFWPYFRQTVSDITARMYIAPITVPLTSR